jgi:hypothetical protein
VEKKRAEGAGSGLKRPRTSLAAHVTAPIAPVAAAAASAEARFINGIYGLSFMTQSPPYPIDDERSDHRDDSL